MRDAIDTVEKDGFTMRTYVDEDPTSPKEWDQLGTLVTWHRNYVFDKDGKKEFGEPTDFIKQAKREGWIYLPVAMYDHSGISLYEGKARLRSVPVAGTPAKSGSSTRRPRRQRRRAATGARTQSASCVAS